MSAQPHLKFSGFYLELLLIRRHFYVMCPLGTSYMDYKVSFTIKQKIQISVRNHFVKLFHLQTPGKLETSQK